MKKIIFGGFCLLSGILLFMLMQGLDISLLYGTNVLDILVKAIGIAMAIYGFVLGVSGLKEDK